MSIYHFPSRSRNRLDRQVSLESGGNVVRLQPDTTEAFQTLTARVVMAQHRAGTLDPAVVEALLAGVGLRP
jgi:hypothetical protein